MTRNRKEPKPAFLNKREVHQLACRLHTSDFVVATVLKVAGHVLRERYRRRGWIFQKRDPAANNAEGTERAIVAGAIEAVEVVGG
jgi:hypothetical protein